MQTLYGTETYSTKFRPVQHADDTLFQRNANRYLFLYKDKGKGQPRTGRKGPEVE